MAFILHLESKIVICWRCQAWPPTEFFGSQIAEWKTVSDSGSHGALTTCSGERTTVLTKATESMSVGMLLLQLRQQQLDILPT